MYCKCGKLIDTTGGQVSLYYQVNNEGKVIFEICSHGVVVIDNRVKETPKNTMSKFVISRKLDAISGFMWCDIGTCFTENEVKAYIKSLLNNTFISIITECLGVRRDDETVLDLRDFL
jgi:hypothetical protein